MLREFVCSVLLSVAPNGLLIKISATKSNIFQLGGYEIRLGKTYMTKYPYVIIRTSNVLLESSG